MPEVASTQQNIDIERDNVPYGPLELKVFENWQITIDQGAVESVLLTVYRGPDKWDQQEINEFRSSVDPSNVPSDIRQGLRLQLGIPQDHLHWGDDE